MNLKHFSLLITNILLCHSLPHQLLNKRGNEPLRGQGDVTYYGEGGSDPAPTGPEGGSPGACGVAPRNEKYFAALNYVQYGEYSNPNNSIVCRRCVKVEHGSNKVVVEIVDKCPVCKSGDIDLSPTAFTELFGGLEVGRVHNVNWYEVSCDELGKSNNSSNDSSMNKIHSNNNWNEKKIDNNDWNIQQKTDHFSYDQTVAVPIVPTAIETITSTIFVSSTLTSTIYTTKTSTACETSTIIKTLNSMPTFIANNKASLSKNQNNYEVLIGKDITNTSQKQSCTCLVSICNPNIPIKYDNEYN